MTMADAAYEVLGTVVKRIFEFAGVLKLTMISFQRGGESNCKND